MPRDIDPRLLVPAPLRRIPSDLAAIFVFVLATLLSTLLPVVNETPVRLVLAVPFVLFAPGYAFVAVLFPEGSTSSGKRRSVTDRIHDRFETGIDTLERVALSFGTSIAIVPLIGLVLNVTSWGIRLLPVLVALSGFTLLTTAVAVVRRWNAPEETRFSVSFRRTGAEIRTELFEPETRFDAMLNVVLVACLLLVAASIMYAVTVPNTEEQFTEFYLLSTDKDDTLAADEYPTDFTVGEKKPVYVGLQNHEQHRKRYTVVVLLQRVTRTDDSTNVHREQEVARYRPVVEENGTWQKKTVIAPRMTGENLRLQYLLYRGDAPAELNADTAYQELHLWINVSEPNPSSPGDRS
ncbi:DUF1616 domain-containing protein [Haladaptatus caseinilyticus]|uniref:DUF1616 domain-containing protein n=1 Tax=Haladaptatus caseinilyticus TaxID=2993314 RepID=UPI00224A4E0F|nr:DUF1616 domain-containing protein [Haladaptatus caseinilyticus]